MYSCIISQFLDESSNLKAGCKKDVHDAFDTIYVSYTVDPRISGLQLSGGSDYPDCLPTHSN